MRNTFYKGAAEGSASWDAGDKAGRGTANFFNRAWDWATSMAPDLTPKEGPKKIPGGWVSADTKLEGADPLTFTGGGVTSYQYGRNPHTGEPMKRRISGHAQQDMHADILGPGDYAAIYRAGGGPVTVHDQDASRRMSPEAWAKEKAEALGPVFSEGEQALAPEGWRMSGSISQDRSPRLFRLVEMSGSISQDGSPRLFRFTGPEGEQKRWRPGSGAPFAPQAPAPQAPAPTPPRATSPTPRDRLLGPVGAASQRGARGIWQGLAAPQIMAQDPQQGQGQMQILGSREPEPPTPEMLKVARGLFC